MVGVTFRAKVFLIAFEFEQKMRENNSYESKSWFMTFLVDHVSKIIYGREISIARRVTYLKRIGLA